MFDGDKKAMEVDSIVKMVLKLPKLHGAYVYKLFMEYDTTTPSHLQEDTETTSKGRLPKLQAGIDIAADPSHRKCVVGNAYYDLVKKRVKVSRIKMK